MAISQSTSGHCEVMNAVQVGLGLALPTRFRQDLVQVLLGLSPAEVRSGYTYLWNTIISWNRLLSTKLMQTPPEWPKFLVVILMRH